MFVGALTSISKFATTSAPPNTGEACFENGGDAVEALSNGNPPILFGYIHRTDDQLPSTLPVFTEEILPSMKDKGYLDLVLEVFPVGTADSKIENELREFNAFGKIGAEMKRFLPYSKEEEANFIALLERAHSLGIAIHSGGVDYATRHQTVLNSDYAGGDPRPRRLGNQQIIKNSPAKINQLRQKGKRPFSLGGALHNDLRPRLEYSNMSFARQIPGAVEIDLLVPGLAINGDDKFLALTPALKREQRWKTKIPGNGVRLIQGNTAKSFLILWPWGSYFPGSLGTTP